MRKLLLAILLSICMAGYALAVPIAGVYSTGVDAAGSLLDLGVLDPHYTIAMPNPANTSDAYTTDGAYTAWAAATATSQWITPYGYESKSGWPTTAPDGWYSYELTFDLSAYDHTTAVISGSWATDNNAEIFLNNVTTGITSVYDGFRVLNPTT